MEMDETHEQTPPLSDELLAEIRARATTPHSDRWTLMEIAEHDTQATVDRTALLAEVDRLRAREAAMRDVLQEVVTVDERGTYIHTYDDGYYADCPYCGATSREPGHRPDCLITKARAVR